MKSVVVVVMVMASALVTALTTLLSPRTSLLSTRRAALGMLRWRVLANVVGDGAAAFVRWSARGAAAALTGELCTPSRPTTCLPATNL